MLATLQRGLRQRLQTPVTAAVRMRKTLPFQATQATRARSWTVSPGNCCLRSKRTCGRRKRSRMLCLVPRNRVRPELIMGMPLRQTADTIRESNNTLRVESCSEGKRPNLANLRQDGRFLGTNPDWQESGFTENAGESWPPSRCPTTNRSTAVDDSAEPCSLL